MHPHTIARLVAVQLDGIGTDPRWQRTPPQFCFRCDTQMEVRWAVPDPYGTTIRARCGMHAIFCPNCRCKSNRLGLPMIEKTRWGFSFVRHR